MKTYSDAMKATLVLTTLYFGFVATAIFSTIS